MKSSESVNLRTGPCLERLREAKAKAEKKMGITLTWPQFFDLLLNRAEEVERGR